MNSDYRDLIAEFNAHGVEYIVVGAHALAAHGHVRATKDLDVWVRPSLDNARRVMSALHAFGAALHDLTLEDLASPGVVFQIGIEPVRIDVITAIDGVEFDDAWPRRLQTTFADQPASVLSRVDLIKNKTTTARAQDIADVEWLQEHPDTDEKVP